MSDDDRLNMGHTKSGGFGTPGAPQAASTSTSTPAPVITTPNPIATTIDPTTSPGGPGSPGTPQTASTSTSTPAPGTTTPGPIATTPVPSTFTTGASDGEAVNQHTGSSTNANGEGSDAQKGHPGAAVFRKPKAGWAASLLASSYWALAVAAAVTVIVYVLPTWKDEADSPRQWDNYAAIACGIAAGAIVATGYAWGLQRSSAPNTMNPTQFSDLCHRWSGLDTWVRLLCPVKSDSTEIRQQSCAEAQTHRDFVGRELGLSEDDPENPEKTSSGGKWVIGYGYVELWQRLHDAEASLFGLQRREQLVSNGLYDELRLIGSKMTHEDALLARLRAAIVAVGGKEHLSAESQKVYGELSESPEGSQAETEARLILGDVRRSINQNRDDSRAGLLRTRNHLGWAGLVTGLVAHALLGLAVLVGVDRKAIVAATAFYLAGAIVGLFAQLRSSTRDTQSGEDDFGLAKARLMYAPVMSGLAAIGGVLLMAVLYPTLDVPIDLSQAASDAVNSGAAGTPTAGADNGAISNESIPVEITIPSYTTIFDLSQNRFGIVVAAIFGLTPDLLINRLQGQADRYKSDLESTSVQTRADLR